MNLLPFRVYQILSEYTDADHALTMGELLRLLWTECGLRCDRRAVYAALDKLWVVGCHIPEYQDDGEGYRLLPHPLEPSEVRLLSDAVSAFPGISQRQCERLLEKLGRGLSRWQREQCRPLSVGTPWRGINPETFLSVEVLEEAISRRCQVEFQYMTWNMAWTSGSTLAGSGPIGCRPTASASQRELLSDLPVSGSSGHQPLPGGPDSISGLAGRRAIQA